MPCAFLWDKRVTYLLCFVLYIEERWKPGIQLSLR